jgi:hypothetical protein
LGFAALNPTYAQSTPKRTPKPRHHRFNTDTPLPLDAS